MVMEVVGKWQNPSFWKDHVIYEQHRLWRHGQLDLAQDGLRSLIAPIVQNPA